MSPKFEFKVPCKVLSGLSEESSSDEAMLCIRRPPQTVVRIPVDFTAASNLRSGRIVHKFFVSTKDYHCADVYVDFWRLFGLRRRPSDLGSVQTPIDVCVRSLRKLRQLSTLMRFRGLPVDYATSFGSGIQAQGLAGRFSLSEPVKLAG